MFHGDRSTRLILFSCLFNLLAISSVQAQIRPDNTLGNENSIITENVTINNAIADLIEGGAIRDNNLFHSFLEFNIPDGNSVYFASPDGIANILTRVTGNNLSEIFGTLGVDGAANLFLLNPNGIVFGENAALYVNGSFLATTAESYIFENGFEYSASNPETPPLLTINIPVGLQFGSQAESIVNQSFSFNDFDELVGLEVSPEENITLIGGDILFEGGTATASNGSIEIGSVAPNSLVKIIPTENNWQLDYTGIDNFQNIDLTQSASINSSGDGAGKINITANNLNVLEGSNITANNYGEQNGGNLNINTQESLKVAGANSDGFLSFITAEVYDTGDGANLTIETKSLQITDGSFIANGNFGTGKGGNLTVKATEEVLISGMDDDDYPSFIATGTFNSGDGGNLTIEAADLSVTDSAFVSADTFDSGHGGNFLINVERLTIKNGSSQVGTGTFGDGNSGDTIVNASKSVEIIGTGLVPSFEVEGEYDLFSSGLFASVEPGATGNGGNLTVNTETLRISEGGKIVASTLGTGDGGNILIKANNLEVKGTVVDNIGTRSGINSTVEFEGSGNGGNLDIIVNNLDLIDGGSIAVDTKGQGHAGDINLQAQHINISGVSSSEPVHGFEQHSLPSEISASSLGDDDAGLITIDTETLNLYDHGLISVSNLGNGNSGNLNITANELNLDNSATIEAEVNAGTQGNIDLITDDIFLRNNSEITAKATDTATGGNITINNSDNIVLLDDSQIIADAVEGNGGNINIATKGLFVSPNSSISASSQFGLDGNVAIETLNGDRPIELKPLPIAMVDATQQITASCSVGNNKFAIAGQGGLPENPTQNLRGQTIWQDLRLLTDNAAQLTSNSLSLPEYPHKTNIIEAQSWKINQQGKVELIAMNHNHSRSSFSHNTPQCSQITSN